MNVAPRSFWGRAECGVFASRGVTAHLLRGALAATLVAWAVVNLEAHPVLALAAGAVAVVAMRGCPMCWMVGLFETVAYAIRARSRA